MSQRIFHVVQKLEDIEAIPANIKEEADEYDEYLNLKPKKPKVLVYDEFWRTVNSENMRKSLKTLRELSIRYSCRN